MFSPKNRLLRSTVMPQPMYWPICGAQICFPRHFTSNNQEILHDFFIGDFEDPVAFVSPYQIWGVFEDHFWFFATENSAFLCDASEEAWVGAFIFVDSFPFEIIGKWGWVNHIESLCVFDFSSKRLELNDIIFGLNIRLFLSKVGWS